MKDDLFFFNNVFETLNTLGEFKAIEDIDIQKWFNKIFEDVENKKSKLSDPDLTVIANLYMLFSIHQEKKIQETMILINDTIH
tara:strand:- start:128 stop:376 length:249 start_codon:yes stop_codon:yes gene_type:complete